MIWITWEKQRRSVELSGALGIKLLELSYYGNKFLKPLIPSLKTIYILYRFRPQIVFVQNPSNVLAALVCLLRRLFNFMVIVDRHSNFIFSESDARHYSKWSILFANFMSNYSIRNANLTIVTNKYIKNIIENIGGRGFVLQDKLPELTFGREKKLKGKYNIVFVCTFSPDEPVTEVIKAGKYIDENIYIYITGNNQKYNDLPQTSIPKNVIFTGFLPEEDYQTLLCSSDILLALTIRDHTLLCAAYESVALCKPCILSRKKDLNEYFYKGSIVTDNYAYDIADAINNTLRTYDILLKEIKELRQEILRKWPIQFNELKSILKTLN